MTSLCQMTVMWLQSLQTHWVVGKLYMCNIRARSVLDQFSACVQESKKLFSPKNKKFGDGLYVIYSTSQRGNEMPLPMLCPIPFINVHSSSYQNKISSLSMYSDLQRWHGAIPDSKSVIDAVIAGICFWYFRLVRMWCLWMTNVICGVQLRSLL